MTEPSTTEVLRRALVDEPPMTLHLEDITERGGRLRRRRRLGRATLVSATVALVGLALVWAPWAGTPGTARTTNATSAAPIAGAAGSASTAAAKPSSHLAETVEAASPSGWTFDWKDEALETSVAGTVDDGTGLGGVSVGISTGSQQVHPCRDAEFRMGATCTESVLAGGAVLSRRGLAVADGVRSIEVVLTYPDGSGSNAGASNAIVPPGPGKPLHLQVTRPAPAYTIAQLVAVVLAVDAAQH